MGFGFQSNLCCAASYFNPWKKNQQLAPRPCGFAAVASPDDEGDTGFEERTESLRIFRAKRTVSGRSWESLLNSQRIAAIRKWAGGHYVVFE